MIDNKPMNNDIPAQLQPSESETFCKFYRLFSDSINQN